MAAPLDTSTSRFMVGNCSSQNRIFWGPNLEIIIFLLRLMYYQSFSVTAVFLIILCSNARNCGDSFCLVVYWRLLATLWSSLKFILNAFVCIYMFTFTFTGCCFVFAFDQLQGWRTWIPHFSGQKTLMMSANESRSPSARASWEWGHGVWMSNSDLWCPQWFDPPMCSCSDEVMNGPLSGVLSKQIRSIVWQ